MIGIKYEVPEASAEWGMLVFFNKKWEAQFFAEEHGFSAVWEIRFENGIPYTNNKIWGLTPVGWKRITGNVCTCGCNL